MKQDTTAPDFINDENSPETGFELISINKASYNGNTYSWSSDAKGWFKDTPAPSINDKLIYLSSGDWKISRLKEIIAEHEAKHLQEHPDLPTEKKVTAIYILNDRGFKANSDLPFCTADGTEYYVGYSNGKRAAIVTLIESEDKYLLTKETLREMAKTAGTYGIKEITLYTNYGCEICTSQGESPKTVGLHNIIKINVDGFNADRTPTENNTGDKSIEEFTGDWFISGGMVDGYEIRTKSGGVIVSPHTIYPVSHENAELIVKAVNNFEDMLSIVKRVKFWFDNEANYPVGTAGHTIAQEAKQILSRI